MAHRTRRWPLLPPGVNCFTARDDASSYKCIMDRARANPPLCPNCGEPMRLARVIAGTADLAPVNVFECAPCGVYYSEAGCESPAVAERGSFAASQICSKYFLSLINGSAVPVQRRRSISLTETFLMAAQSQAAA